MRLDFSRRQRRQRAVYSQQQGPRSGIAVSKILYRICSRQRAPARTFRRCFPAVCPI